LKIRRVLYGIQHIDSREGRENKVVESFPRTLSYLRKERKISQKEAAASLGVSQALLSHYENGLREPGLEFAVKAAEYYGVTTDYLLGLSGEREGNRGKEAAAPVEEPNQTDPAILLRKKTTLYAIELIYDLIGKTGSRELGEEAGNFLDMAVYKLFRHLYAAGERDDRFFSIARDEAEDLSDAEIRRTEGLIKMILRGKGKTRSEKIPALSEFSEETLRRDYPDRDQWLLTLLRKAGDRLERLMKL